MIKVGIIIRDNGKMRFVEHCESVRDMPSADARKINLESLDRAHALLVNDDNILADTFLLRIKESQVPKVKELVLELTRKVCKILEQEGANEVFRLSAQLVPHTFGNP